MSLRPRCSFHLCLKPRCTFSHTLAFALGNKFAFMFHRVLRWLRFHRAASTCGNGADFQTAWRLTWPLIRLCRRSSKLTGCRSFMLIGSSLSVSSRLSCVLRLGMLHICSREENCQFIKHHIITQRTSMWLFRMRQEEKKVPFAGCSLFSRTGGLWWDYLRREESVAGLSTAWFSRETEGLTPWNNWLSCLFDLCVGANL